MRTGTLPAAFASALACSACTIVHVEGVKRPVIAGGVLHFEPAPGAHHISFRTKGFGIVPGTRGVTLGAAREESVWVYDPQDCRIVVFSAPKWLADALVAQRDHFCVVGGEGK